jgi:hypothetical protein
MKTIAMKKAVCLLVLACFGAGPLWADRHSTVDHEGDGGYIQEEKTHIEVGKAKRVAAHFAFRSGIIRLTGGADALLEGTFTYSRDEWRPEVSYRVGKGKGYLDVEAGGNFSLGGWDFGSGSDKDTDRNEWDLRINDTIPLDLHIEVGAGEGHLDLAGLDLEELHLAMGAGDFEIDLSGTSVPRLLMEAGVGSATVDLSGEWENDLDARFRCGVGALVLVLPRDVGVRVEVDGLLGSVDANGFNVGSGRYTNDAYGKAGKKLNISVAGGIGEVELRLVD